jgi:1,4-dihydroxy-6-naphthoate synthase
LKGERVAVPGKLTTAYLVLKLYEPDFEPVVMPFDKVLDTVLSGEVRAGLVIHEGQLSYSLGYQRGIIEVPPPEVIFSDEV